MFRGIRNELKLRVVGYDLTACTDLTLFVRQNGVTYTYTGTADGTDTEIMHVTIPKADAVEFAHMTAEIQVALTDGNGDPKINKPIKVVIGDCLSESGYGS